MTEPAGLIGRHLGSYRILSLLGAGGMGEVYRAYDEKLQRPAAVKVLRGSEAGDDAAGARLLREARAAAALNHPNICTVYEVGEHDGRGYIAMELVEGEPLHRVIPDGTGLPGDRAIEYARQIADALAHAHGQGVLHRDLKTANIVITKAGRAKILDFGLAKRVATNLGDTTELASVHTAVGTIAGTPAYMAPEQLRGGVTDARTDLWALGVVLHEMAAGERPFAGRTPFELSSAILNEPARPLPEQTPRTLQTVIARCLQKDPADRLPGAAEVLTQLDAAPAAALPAAAPRATPHTSSRLRGLVIAAASIVLIAAAVVLTLNASRLADWLWPRRILFDSVAVLPLDTVSGDVEQAYMAAGVQQALITELAQLPGFTKVAAAASTRRLRGSNMSLPDIARALGVRALVTGSLARIGDRVRISAQLIDAASEHQVWGDTYERETSEVIALQNDVVSDIAGAIEVRLRPEDRERLAARATIKPATYELYLRGMHELDSVREGGDRSAGLKLLQEAIDKDPGDPHAYAGLAKGYAALGHSPSAPADAWISARAAADRAITLKPDLADAHAVMGDVKLYYEWDWAGAERAFRRANELNPNLAMNHYHYAWYLFLVGRLDEAIREHERARDLDPMTASHTAWLADLYRAARRYDDAIATAKKSLELNANSAVSWSILSHTYSDQNRHEEAVEAAKRAVALGPPQTFALGVAYARAGRIGDAQTIRQAMESRPRTSYGMWARAILYLYLGDADAFFEAIAHEPHHGFVPWIRTHPELDRFRSDPRYAALMARFKLPAPAPRPSQ